MSNLCSLWSIHYHRLRAAVTLHTLLTEHISKIGLAVFLPQKIIHISYPTARKAPRLTSQVFNHIKERSAGAGRPKHFNNSQPALQNKSSFEKPSPSTIPAAQEAKKKTAVKIKTRLWALAINPKGSRAWKISALWFRLTQFSSRNLVALQGGRCTMGGLGLVERVQKDHVSSRTETV